MKRRLALAAGWTVLLLASSELFGRLAVANDAAGALLSAGGLGHPFAFALAMIFALSRIGGALMICVTAGFAAAYLTQRGLLGR